MQIMPISNANHADFKCNFFIFAWFAHAYKFKLMANIQVMQIYANHENVQIYANNAQICKPCK